MSVFPLALKQFWNVKFYHLFRFVRIVTVGQILCLSHLILMLVSIIFCLSAKLLMVSEVEVVSF